MIIMFYLSLFIIILSSIMMILSIFLSKKTMMDREKSSPFECGFDPKSISRLPFSLHFFLITIIFLIFDVEIILMLPMIMNFFITNLFIWSMVSIFFMLILLLGIYHEWNQNMLNWTN